MYDAPVRRMAREKSWALDYLKTQAWPRNQLSLSVVAISTTCWMQVSVYVVVICDPSMRVTAEFLQSNGGGQLGGVVAVALRYQGRDQRFLAPGLRLLLPPRTLALPRGLLPLSPEFSSRTLLGVIWRRGRLFTCLLRFLNIEVDFDLSLPEHLIGNFA